LERGDVLAKLVGLAPLVGAFLLLAAACDDGSETVAPNSTRTPTLPTPSATATSPATPVATTTPTPDPTATQTPTGTPTATPTVPSTPAATATLTPTPQATAVDPAAIDLQLETVAGGFDTPVFVTQPPGDSERLFVVEKPGRIRIIEAGEVLDQPFLDVADLIDAGSSEQGLLGLAFHPDYGSNGRFFIYYTAAESGDNTVAEYRVSEDPMVAAPGSGRVLLAVADFAGNHNGGMLAFGPDGYLYAALGDGGGGGDPEGNGQRLDALLGKILRIDIDGEDSLGSGRPYAIPPGNPFADGEDGAQPEIWAYGLRNPWRFSFDRATGDLWIADVGQGSREEVNLEPLGTGGGRNYGWNRYEGTECFNDEGGCGRRGLEMPVYDYGHELGCSVTGGYVYRGFLSPALDGLYIFGDYCSGIIWGLDQRPNGRWRATELLASGALITSFGEDNAGELYLADASAGVIARIVATVR
jgi:glucose/arabinose dehydrogenase